MIKFSSLIVVSVLLLSSAHSYAQSQDTLRIAMYHSPPFVSYDDQNEPEGVSIWLWQQISDAENIPHKFINYDEHDSPLQKIQDDLASGKIDISINPFTITSKRQKRFDFTYPFYIGNLSGATHQSSRLEGFFNFIGSLKNSKVVILTAILVIFMTLFGYFIWLVEKKSGNFEKDYQGVVSGFWWSAVTMTTVGYGDKVPVTRTGMLIAIVWMIFSMGIVAIFTATITSVLTVDQLSNEMIDKEVLKNKKVGTVEASAAEEYLRRNFFTDVRTYPTFTDGLDHLTQNEIDVFIYDEPWLRYEINNVESYKELSMVQARFHMQYYAFPISKSLDHETRKKIDSGLLRVIESHDWSMLLHEYNLPQH